MNCEWSSGLKKPENRISLHRLNTPFQTFKIPKSLLSHTYEDKNFYIKRDDLTGLFSSGNKIRKLEFLLAKAKSLNCDTIVSYGKKQSNWCRAVAAAGRYMGFEVHLMLNCDDADCFDALSINGNYLVDIIMGAYIHIIKPEVYNKFNDNYKDNKLLLKLTKHLEKQGKKCFPLCCGGTDIIGTWGYIDMVRELELQIKQKNTNITDIIVPTASGGTAIGIAIGTYLCETFCRPRIHAMTTMGENINYYKAISDQLLIDIGFTKKTGIKNICDIIQFHDATGIGYGKNTMIELNFFLELANKSGVLVDPVYNGKALYYFIKKVSDGSIKLKGNNILFVHTGGTFAYFQPTIVKKLNSATGLFHRRKFDFVSKL